MENLTKSEHAEIVKKIAERQFTEQIAVGSTNTEILQRLGTPLTILPQKCRSLLKQAAEYQTAMDLPALDPVTFTLQQTDSALRQMDDEYELLLLRQKNEELEERVKKNEREIKQWRMELDVGRKDLKSLEPNPETVLDEIRIVKQKVASYEQSCEKTKAKFNSLRVPIDLYPEPLEALISRLETLRAEAADLKEKADHILLARSAKQKLLQLKATKF